MKKKDLMKRLENYEITEKHEDLIKRVAEEYEDKSDDEIFVEIIKLNSKMEEELSFEEYEMIFEKLESIRHLLTEEQNRKLDNIIDTLNNNR